MDHTIEIQGFKRSKKVVGACLICQDDDEIDALVAVTVDEKERRFPAHAHCILMKNVDLEEQVRQRLLIEENPVLLTPEEYVAKGGTTCPRCKAQEALEGNGSIDIDGSEVSQEITCTNCGLIIYDIYKLTGYEIAD